MDDRQLDPETRRVSEIASRRLATVGSCSQTIDAGTQVLDEVWKYILQSLGEAGTQAVMSRAVRVAMRRSPLVQYLRIGEDGVDAAELREHSIRDVCEPAELGKAFEQIIVTIFQTLSDLTGSVITEPLLRHLEGRMP